MDTLADGPPDEGAALSLNQLTTNDWPNSPAGNVSNNSTLLYIAVEYVKPSAEFRIEPGSNLASPETTYTNFQQHVSPLDPNMSSVARYSPVYSESSGSYNNSVIVHQLVSTVDEMQQNAESFINSLPVESPSTSEVSSALVNAELKPVIGNRYLQMMTDEEISAPDASLADGLQLVPDSEQEVELLITDQATGISYSVSTQEFLVERCLDDEQQLLDALAPGPLLDTDLLTLDDNTLKSQLTDIGDPTGTIVSQASDIFVPLSKDDKIEDCENAKTEELRRSKRHGENAGIDDNWMSRMYSISDKPVLSRARATLPEAYLVINKNNNGLGVFARKIIPKRTQFGPLEGIIKDRNETQKENEMEFLIENEDGSISCLDISDENTSNWMCFVRRATKYNEHNLTLTQQGNSLYYITTKTINPRQELLVDYSNSYAEKHNLTNLKPENSVDEDSWPCFECSQRFTTSEQLQKHLNVHDDVKDENVRPRKKSLRNKRKMFKKQQEPDIVECNVCKGNFMNPKYNFLKKHLLEHGLDSCASLHKFTILKNFRCDECAIWFNSESLLKIHNLQHDVDDPEEQTVNVCPSCHHKFPTQKQLISHVLQHAVRKATTEPFKGYKCTACYKMFATRERIQRHMLVHGSDESKPLQCNTCKKRFLNNSALACHLKTHYIGKKIFECPICKESFDHVLQLKLHVSKHSENGQYTCPHCNKIFKKYSIIRKHIRAFHCERIHSCPDCSKRFPTLDKLRMHLLKHSDHREFLCADCGKQFKRKDKLKEHCKRMHSDEMENNVPNKTVKNMQMCKKFTPKVEPTDYHRFIYKCHACMVGFKRRGMLVNHLAKRHPDISPDSVPELNLPILRTTRDYYCQYCDKVYKSSSKRKAHILKNHPGAALPMSNRRQGSYPEVAGLPNPSFSQTVGSVTTHPQSCQWCHKQYASKAKLLQHQRKKHSELIPKRDTKIDKNVEENVITKRKDVVVNEQGYKRDFEVSEEEMLSDIIEFKGDKEGSYYQLVSVTSGETLTTTIGSSDSRLYRLLTTSNGSVPPR